MWVGSVWYSSVYNFNDKDKVLGIQPGCEFAAPIVNKFFVDVKVAIGAHILAMRVAKKTTSEAAEAKKKEALEFYRKLVVEGQGLDGSAR